MVLESIIHVKEAVKNPWWVLVVSGFIALISLVVSALFFSQSIGLFSVFLYTFAMTPFMVKLMFYTDIKEEELIKRRQKGLLAAHKDVILTYTAMFAGVVIVLTLVYLFLPQATVQSIFNEQINEIKMIRGSFLFEETYLKIVLNNIGVLLLCFIFSFLYGSGAVFILSWNASVLSCAIGMLARSMGGAKALPFAILVFLPHGSLEILAYFLGGIAGGIISAEVSRKKSHWLTYVFWDAAILMTIAALLIVVAGAIETISIMSA